MEIKQPTIQNGMGLSADYRYMVRVNDYTIYELNAATGDYVLVAVTREAAVATRYLLSGLSQTTEDTPPTT